MNRIWVLITIPKNDMRVPYLEYFAEHADLVKRMEEQGANWNKKIPAAAPLWECNSLYFRVDSISINDMGIASR